VNFVITVSGREMSGRTTDGVQAVAARIETSLSPAICVWRRRRSLPAGLIRQDAKMQQRLRAVRREIMPETETRQSNINLWTLLNLTLSRPWQQQAKIPQMS